MCIDMRRTCHVLLYRISVITSLSSVQQIPHPIAWTSYRTENTHDSVKYIYTNLGIVKFVLDYTDKTVVVVESDDENIEDQKKNEKKK